jgi:cytochrome c oxidase assembly protein subunit 15
MTWFRRLSFAAAILCAVVIILGAWVRLTAAGLGCPDWPTCYGHLTAGAAWENQAAASAAYPDRPLEYGKAVREMTHRYAASTLGLIIAALAAWALVNRRDPRQPLRVPLLLLLIVILQGILGMLTVTWLLEPTIVTLHLLGGLTTLSLLWWLSLDPDSSKESLAEKGQEGLRRLTVIALVMLGLQIALGGWTSSNYAAVACPDFPTCQGSWWPSGDFRVAIHFTHRLGALATTTVLVTLASVIFARAHSRRLRRAASGILLALALQLSIGIAMVIEGFPLPLAVAHNAGAALLLLTVVTLLRHLQSDAPLAAPTSKGIGRL